MNKNHVPLLGLDRETHFDFHLTATSKNLDTYTMSWDILQGSQQLSTLNHTKVAPKNDYSGFTNFWGF